MMIDPARMDWSRLVPFAILAASIGALATAYTAELAIGIEPCILCLYQRIVKRLQFAQKAGVEDLLGLQNRDHHFIAPELRLEGIVSNQLGIVLLEKTFRGAVLGQKS